MGEDAELILIGYRWHRWQFYTHVGALLLSMRTHCHDLSEANMAESSGRIITIIRARKRSDLEFRCDLEIFFSYRDKSWSELIIESSKVRPRK